MAYSTWPNESPRSTVCQTAKLTQLVKVAGCVITANAPELPKTFVFLSLEDETGM